MNLNTKAFNNQPKMNSEDSQLISALMAPVQLAMQRVEDQNFFIIVLSKIVLNKLGITTEDLETALSQTQEEMKTLSISKNGVTDLPEEDKLMFIHAKIAQFRSFFLSVMGETEASQESMNEFMKLNEEFMKHQMATPNLVIPK